MSVIDDVNSVEPLIPDWTTAGTDLGNETIRDRKIYAINHGGLLCINLLYNMPNMLIKIRSYNSETTRKRNSWETRYFCTR